MPKNLGCLPVAENVGRLFIIYSLLRVSIVPTLAMSICVKSESQGHLKYFVDMLDSSSALYIDFFSVK